MSVFNAYMTLSGATDAQVLKDERLAHHTSYRIGGPAALFVTAHSLTGLTKVLKVLKDEHVEWVILGKGSNILAADKGYDGCVIVLDKEFSRISVGEDGLVTAGAGALLSKVVNEALKASLSGLECCVGIPGTVGGAVSMDAGSRREWIGRRVRDLVVLRPGEGLHRYQGGEIEWGYRATSIPTSEIILEATFALEPGDRKEMAEDMDSRLRRRRSTQPMGKPTCGSVFKNPPDHSVGMLIDRCGLKGTERGGAQISTEHANFIVNNGSAKAADVVGLMGQAHESVMAKFGIDLQCEVKLLGFGA